MDEGDSARRDRGARCLEMMKIPTASKIMDAQLALGQRLGQISNTKSKDFSLGLHGVIIVITLPLLKHPLVAFQQLWSSDELGCCCLRRHCLIYE